MNAYWDIILTLMFAYIKSDTKNYVQKGLVFVYRQYSYMPLCTRLYKDVLIDELNVVDTRFVRAPWEQTFGDREIVGIS